MQIFIIHVNVLGHDCAVRVSKGPYFSFYYSIYLIQLTNGGINALRCSIFLQRANDAPKGLTSLNSSQKCLIFRCEPETLIITWVILNLTHQLYYENSL